MRYITTYYKNSNTGELMMQVETVDTFIKGIPTYFYDINHNKIGENLSIEGFVEISEKKWKKYQKKYK